jgi:hypothetical protein
MVTVFNAAAILSYISIYMYSSSYYFSICHTKNNWLFKATWMEAASHCCQMDMRLIVFDDLSKLDCFSDFVDSTGN